MRVPARRRAGAHLPRGVGRGRGADGVDEGRALHPRLRRVRPASAARAHARRGASTRPAGTVASVLELSLGTQATDRMVGEPTTFTKAWFDAFEGAADASAAARPCAHAEDRAGDRAHADRERDRDAGDAPRSPAAAAGNEGVRGRGSLAGLRPRAGDSARRRRARVALLAHLGRQGDQDVHGDVGPAGGRGRARPLRDLGLRRRLLGRSHEEPRDRRAQARVRGARGSS